MVTESAYTTALNEQWPAGDSSGSSTDYDARNAHAPIDWTISKCTPSLYTTRVESDTDDSSDDEGVTFVAPPNAQNVEVGDGSMYVDQELKKDTLLKLRRQQQEALRHRRRVGLPTTEQLLLTAVSRTQNQINGEHDEDAAEQRPIMPMIVNVPETMAATDKTAATVSASADLQTSDGTSAKSKKRSWASVADDEEDAAVVQLQQATVVDETPMWEKVVALLLMFGSGVMVGLIICDC